MPPRTATSSRGFATLARPASGGRGGRGKGRWNNNDDNNYQQNPQANAAQQQPAAKDDNLPDEAPGGYQVPRGVACILGGALAPASNRHFKQIAREICAALPGVEASRPLKWSQYPITFDSSDHPKSTATVGTIPLVCTPTINNIAVSKTLIDGGAGLSVISVEIGRAHV